jgi:hypothetical protein
VAGGDGYLDTGRDGEDLIRRELAVDNGEKVQTGIAGVSIDGELGLGMNAFDSEFHGVTFQEDIRPSPKQEGPSLLFRAVP